MIAGLLWYPHASFYARLSPLPLAKFLEKPAIPHYTTAYHYCLDRVPSKPRPVGHVLG